MIKTVQQAFSDIVAHISKQRGSYSSWYCGVTANVDQRLHEEHKVPRENYWFIVCQCENSNAARLVEDALLKQGCDGGPGGGSDQSVYVYAYLKSPITIP